MGAGLEAMNPPVIFKNVMSVTVFGVSLLKIRAGSRRCRS